MGPIGCPETSVRKYHYALCKIPQGRRYHLHRGGSLKLRFEYKPGTADCENPAFCCAHSKECHVTECKLLFRSAAHVTDKFKHTNCLFVIITIEHVSQHVTLCSVKYVSASAQIPCHFYCDLTSPSWSRCA